MAVKRLASLLVLPLFLLTGCSGIDRGVITEKVYEPGHTVWYTQCIPTGKTVICYPASYYDDEDWVFYLENSKEETGYVNVTEDTWNSYEVGDYYEPPAGAHIHWEAPAS